MRTKNNNSNRNIFFISLSTTAIEHMSATYYFERQVGSKCAIHALNHIFQTSLVGDTTYLPNAKYNIQEVDKQCIMEEIKLLGETTKELLREQKASEHRSGNYSINSITHILHSEGLKTRWISGTHACKHVSTLISATTGSFKESVCILFCDKRHYTIAKFSNIGHGDHWYHWNSTASRPTRLYANSDVLKSLQKCILVFHPSIQQHIDDLLT